MAGMVAPVEAADDPALRPGPTSIRDVARVARVSIMTVSRVLNGHPSVRSSTRTRVLAAVGELGFRPSRAAQALSSRRSKLIGVITAAAPHYGQASCARAVEDAARERGFYTTVTHPATESADDFEMAVEDLLAQKVEGIVLVAPRAGAASTLLPLLGRVPVVAAWGDRLDIGDIPVAATDPQRGARMLMRYLIAQGHRRIVHVAGPQASPEARSRVAAYKSELMSTGLPVLPTLPGDWTAESGYAASRAISTEGLGVTAAFCANDEMALGLIHGLRAAGLDVPGDLSVAGFGDTPEAAHFWPPLTTVRHDCVELGGRCVALLAEAMRGPRDPVRPAPAAVAPLARPELIVRESVGHVEADRIGSRPRPFTSSPGRRSGIRPA